MKSCGSKVMETPELTRAWHVTQTDTDYIKTTPIDSGSHETVRNRAVVNLEYQVVRPRDIILLIQMTKGDYRSLSSKICTIIVIIT